MREFNVGDKVFDFRFGHGVVNHVSGNKGVCYPVEVVFPAPHYGQSFTPDGKWSVSDFGPSLFHADEIPGQSPTQTLTAAATMSRRDEFAIRIGVGIAQENGFPHTPNGRATWAQESVWLAEDLIAELDRTSQKEVGQ